MSIILLFPGQGSQKPGMGKELADAFPVARDVFQQVDDALGVSLSTLCFEGPSDELTQTRHAQPALYAHGAAVWSVVVDAIGASVVAAAGHSLGELTAYYASGAVSLVDGARLVRRRGELMYEEGVKRPGTMAVILGSLSTPIDAICEQATKEAGLVVPANYNSEEQIVISGEVAGVEHAMALAKEAGAKRAMKLNVSGAFHSPLMEPAADAFADAISEANLSDPNFPVYSNVTEQPTTNASDAADLLRRQLTSPVRWAGETRNLATTYPDALFVECGPGNVLTNLMQRDVPKVKAMACGTPADVEKLLQHLATRVS